MTTDKEKIRIQQAHLDGAEIEMKVLNTMQDTSWVNVVETSWDWYTRDYRIKEKQYHFADGSLVTEELKKGKFVLVESYGSFTRKDIVEFIKCNEHSSPTFDLNGYSGCIRWKSLLPLKEPEYIAFTADTFPTIPTLVCVKYDKDIRLVCAVLFGTVYLPTHGYISYKELLEGWEIVNPDGTRSVCGLEVVR